jgi:hypothetical protein
VVSWVKRLGWMVTIQFSEGHDWSMWPTITLAL